MTRLALLGVVALAGCAAPHAIHDEREQPTIVSLNPCTDAILAEVADPAQLLAISHYSHDPRASSMDLATARRFAVTSGTVEEVLALEPDLVVAGGFLPPATAQAFADLGIRVETFGIASSVADSEAQVRRLAELAGHQDRGEALVMRMEAALAQLEASAPLSAVLWQPGGIVPGEGTLVTELMQRAGFASHSATRGMHQADYLALENVLSDPPQVLLVAGQERMQRHPALDAVPRMQRAGFAPSLLYCGGPSVIHAAERLGEVRAELGSGAALALRDRP